MKTLKLFTFLILFATLTVNATNAFHKVSSDNDEFSSFDAIVIDGTLFFTDKNLFLWMSDGTLQGTNRMEVNGNGIKYSGIGYIDETMFEFNNQLVYLNNTDNKMYTTDGVTHTKVSDTQVFQFYPMARDNRLFAFTLTDGKLLVIDNSGSESEYDLGFMGDISKSLCVFDDGDFTLFNADKMYRILNGEILQEDLDFQLGTFKFEYKHDNSCYYSYGAISTNEYNSFKQEKKYFQLSRTGEITNIKLIQDDIENEYWINSFVFDGNIYFSRPGYYSFNGLYELDSESGNLVLIEQTQAQEHSKSNGFIHGERNLYDFINSKYPPFEGSIVVYDKEFKVVNSINGVDTLNTKIYSNEDRELFYFQGKPMIDKIGIIDNIEATEPIQLADIKILRIISDESKVYVFGSDYKNEGKIGLYVVSEQMLISRKLTGLWVSPDWQSQGLSIHTGKRQDVSEYIFVSFYMYRDGNPFWVAGSHDIDSGTNSIEIDLFEFIGSSFLPNDSNYEYQRDTFGKIIIEPTSCNNMNVRIETVGSDTIDLSMRRIGDISNDMTCID